MMNTVSFACMEVKSNKHDEPLLIRNNGTETMTVFVLPYTKFELKAGEQKEIPGLPTTYKLPFEDEWFELTFFPERNIRIPTNVLPATRVFIGRSELGWWARSDTNLQLTMYEG